MDFYNPNFCAHYRTGIFCKFTPILEPQIIFGSWYFAYQQACNDYRNFSISGYQTLHPDVQNVSPPVYVDCTVPAEQWASGRLQPGDYDVILAVNLIHISPWVATTVSPSSNLMGIHTMRDNLGMWRNFLLFV